MSILANIMEVKQKIEAEMAAAGVSETANDLQGKGLAAILGGTNEWVTFMKLFAKTPEELARLIPTDGTETNKEMNEARAYLIGNSTCTPDTLAKLEFGVTLKLEL